MEDLWRLSVADIAALIRSKKVSAKEAARRRLRASTRSTRPSTRRRPSSGRCLAQAAAIDAAIARKKT